MGRLQEQWKQIRGNAKWEAISLILGVCVIPLLSAIGAYLLHAPWPIWVFLVLFAQMAVILPLYIMDTRKKQREIENRPVEKVLKLSLIPHGDNDTLAYLEVENMGEAIDVSAQLRISGKNPNQLFKKFGFVGQWKTELTYNDFLSEQTESYAGDVRIEPNKSRLLTIAKIISMVGQDEQEMAIVGIDDESIVWNTDPHQKKELPYFIVRITLMAKGYPKTKETTYKVGPKTPHGPFQMEVWHDLQIV
jgi:hypothetical protein